MGIEKSALSTLGIHELRNLARQVGVHLPTTFKRGDLEDEIMAIVSGQKEPYVRKDNKGRPPKASKSMSDLTELLLPKDEFSLKESEDVLVFNSNDVVYSDTKEIDFVGYVKVFDNYGIIYTKSLDIVYITLNTINNYDIKTGDYLMGFAREIADGRVVATDVLKINNVTTKNYVRPEVLISSNHKTVNVLGHNIVVGGSNLCRNVNPMEIAKSFGGDYVVILLNINTKSSTLFEVIDNINVINLNFNLTDKMIAEISSLAFDIAKIKASQGKQIILITNSLTEQIKSYNAYLTGSYMADSVKSDAIKVVKNELMYPYSADNSNLTLVDIEKAELPKHLNDILTYELCNFFDNN